MENEFERFAGRLTAVVEAVHADVKTVAEGVAATNERLDHLAGAIDGQFAETQSMIRLSYTALDQRISDLEALKRRVERLEEVVFQSGETA